VRASIYLLLFQYTSLHYRIIARCSYWLTIRSRAVPAIEQTSEVRNDPRKRNSIFPQRELHRSFSSIANHVSRVTCLERNKNLLLKKSWKEKLHSHSESTKHRAQVEQRTHLSGLMTYFRIIRYLSYDKQGSIYVLIEAPGSVQRPNSDFIAGFLPRPRKIIRSRSVVADTVRAVPVRARSRWIHTIGNNIHTPTQLLAGIRCRLYNNAWRKTWVDYRMKLQYATAISLASFR